jgi:hypothetical protein
MPSDPALDPENRRLYGEVLRPPTGYALDIAAATAYTMDFETAMVIPATMALHAAETRQETLDSPIALLEGLERMSDRLAIFCEAGRIQGLTSAVSRLCGLLEDTVIEVSAPQGGAFHPKLWVMRFTAPDAPVLMRMALLSRNLTRDMSWDLCLVLDGARGDKPTDLNNPIRDLLRALPDMATIRAAAPRAHEIVSALSDDLATTTWTLPDGFRRIEFTVNGLGGKVWRPWIGRIAGIVSPFCNETGLAGLVKKPLQSGHLVGRSDQLDMVPAHILQRFPHISVLDDLAETADGEDTTDDPDIDLPARGLHAKAFITQSGATTYITVGSGNATGAPLVSGHNVEVFATLTGKTRLVGSVEDHLSPDRFGRFLRAYTPLDTPTDPEDSSAEDRLETLRRTLAQQELTLTCKETDTQNRIHLTLANDAGFDLGDETSLTIWPVVLGENHGVTADQLARADPLPLGRFALADVTRWIGVRLRDVASDTSLVFSLGCTLQGLPEARNSEILRAFINNRDAFFRYLRFLLGTGQGGLPTLFDGNGKGGWEGAFGAGGGAALLERMVDALTDGTEQLDEVARLIERLGPDAVTQPDSGGAPLIPQDFLTLWAAFQEVRTDGKGNANV